jgi:heme exporter protein D
MEKVAVILFLVAIGFSLTCIVINVMKILTYRRETRELLKQLREREDVLRKAIEEAKKQ